MSVTNVVASASSAVRGLDLVYAIARSTAYSHTLDPNVGQYYFAPQYTTERSFLRFDTSVLPAGEVVSAATLTLTIAWDGTDTDINIQIVEQSWAAQDPIGAGTREAAFDASLAAAASIIWANTAGLSADTPYTSPPLTPSYVNPTGFTYYSLRSSTDKAGTTPIGYENLTFYPFSTDPAAWAPTLNVTTILPGAGMIRSPMWGHFRQDPRIVNVPFSLAGYHRANRRP